MQYIWKLFHWKNGTEREELTQYLSIPVFLERRCNERLHSGQVNLESMPSDMYAKSFPPKSKFTLEKWTEDALIYLTLSCFIKQTGALNKYGACRLRKTKISSRRKKRARFLYRKTCRLAWTKTTEKLNYQLNLLHAPVNAEEDFIVFPNLFGKKKARLIAALLKEPVSMLDEYVAIDYSTIVADDVVYSFQNVGNAIKVNFTQPQGIDLSQVKSIVLYDLIVTEKHAMLAKNVSQTDLDKKLQSWWIYPIYT